MANVREIFNALLISSRRDRKVRLSQAINALKTPTVHNYLNKSSADKWSGRQANSFTWKSVCDIIVHLLQDELHVATVRRNNVSIMTAEFSECFHLLNVFLSHGLETDLKLPLDEVLVFLFGLINDSTLAFLQPFAIDSLSSLLWHLPIETQALEICNLSRLQDWCLDQMKIAPSGPVALLLCHTQNVCFHSRRTLHCNFMSLLEGVLVCFECGWSDSSGLGWFLRLLRWTVAEVCITPDLHRSVFGCFLKRAPILFKLWPKFRETCGQYVPPNLHMLTLDVNDKSSPALAQTVGGCLNDSYALDAYYVTSPVLDDLFINWKDLAKFSSACLLSDACFIAEEKPLLLPDRSSRRPQPNCVDTGRELLAFCRWIINTSVVLKACITVEEIRPFFSLLMNFYTTEWSRHADRMRFQAEDSLCLQLFGMRDFFVTFGTFMEALEAFKMTELLDSLKARSSDCQQPWIYERLFNFVSADDTVGWLWWPVFDWVLRFQWQRAVATESFRSLNCFIALDVISKLLGSAKSSLAIEAAISTAVTALAISTYYIQHGLENIDGFSSCIDRIWNQALLWFEQLSISNLREDSRYRNEKRRALLHDRLISCLLESLLRLDSVSIASQAYVPSRAQHLSSLWNALLSTTVFGNPFAPWRYRLALFAYLIWPKTSIEIVCTTATPIPPPLVFLLTTHPSASDILRYHFLHWSLSCLLRPENPLPEIFPRVSTVPVFGQKHVQLIEKFVNSHLPEPSDLWTCLFFHLVSPKMIETSCLREAVDYVLVDVEQRYGLVTVLFALLQRVSEKEWPSRLSQLIRSLLAHKSTDQLPETVAAHCVDLDLDDGELSSPICELTVGTEDTMATTHLRSFESKILLPLNAFSHPSLLSMTVKCLQEIMTKLSWRSAYDTKWLAALHRYLRKVDFSPTDNESVVDLFCSLVDALKDALKAQLVLKRWSLFLTTVTALNDFGIVLSACLTGVGDKVFHNEIFEKIARQVIKLAETAWVAGGARWPKFEEGFLPPNLGSVFCDSFGVWIRLHSLGLLGDEVPAIPLEVLLIQEDTSTVLQPLRFFQSLPHESKDTLLLLIANLVSRLSGRTKITSPPLLYTLDWLLFLLVEILNRWKWGYHNHLSEKENFPYYSLSQLLEQSSTFHSPVSLIISTCCLLIKHIEPIHIVGRVFLNRLAGKNKAYLGLHLRPYLMPLCLWELSDGRFDPSTCPREFQAAAIAWGYASFEEFLEQSQEYGAFLQIAGIDVAENHPSRFTYNQIAACLFAKDRFPAYIRTLQTANQKAFKCVCCIEGFVAVTSYLFHFVLLFTSDTSADLDRNASRISYHLVSRLTLLFVELFATHQVDTDKLTCSLFSSSSAADNVEQMASRILSQVASFKADFILNLSEALLEAGCHFLKDPRELGADSMYDPLGGYYPRVSVWLAVARFIILLVSSSPNATPTSNSYLNWRLISGIVNLIDVEYKGNRLHRIGFLLTALLDILKAVVKNTCITSSDQLEVAWHNSTVYQLAEVASKLSALPDDVHLDLSQDLIEILDHLFQVRGGNRFSNAICHLDNIFENNALLTPYQPHFSRYCKCNRRDVDEEIHRFLEWTDFLRHPRLLKYRAAGLRHLTALLRPRHEFTTIQLHERLVTVPHERTEEKLRLLEASSIQNWVPSAGSSGCSDVVSEKQLLFRMLIELSTGNHLVEIDPETRLAMAECVASLKATFIDEKSALKPSERARELLIEKSPDPMVVEQLDCVITIANGIASPNSIFSQIGPQCLRGILSNPRLKMSLLGALNISEAERRICILTKLAPYISTEELKNARGAKPQSALKFTTKNVTEAVLYELRSQALVDLALSCGDCPETTVLKIAEWLFDKALVLDEFFLALKPLIIAEVHMAQRLVPWIFAAIFVNLRLLSVPRTGKDMEQALIYLMGVLNTLLERPQLAQFLQSILIALHTYSQWLIRSGIATNLEWDLNWLSASKLSLNAGLMENAWLFFELAWIKRPRELLYDSVAQNLWIDLCTSQKDLVGLKAAQVAMAQFFDQSADGIALEDRFRCAINELDGRWRLLWEEGTGQGDQSSSADVAQIALRLHRLGADKAFSQLATDLLSQDSNILSALTEAKYRVAWRSDTWGIDGSTKPTLRDNILLAIDFKTLPTSKVQPPANPTLTLQREAIESALGVISNLESIRRECASRMGQWNEPEVTPPSNLEDEKLIYLLYQSACCKDWKYVAKLVNDRRSSSIRSLSENPVTLQSFASEANILQAWSHISTLLQNQPDASNARVASSVILLQASIEECIEWDTPQLTSLLEASLRLSKALSDSVDDSSSWLPLLNVHTQLQLADSYIERGNVPCAERLLRTIPRIEIASGELNLRKNLSFALARSKLQRLCGETSLSCARLTGVLNDATEVISNLKLSHDTPARLLLESYLSCTVALCKWLAECSAMSLADIVVRRLKPAIELADKCWSSEAKQPLCNSADALAVLAEFADAQYQVFDGYLRSPEFAARRRLLSDADADAACLTEVDKKSRFLRLLQRQSTLENVELVNLLSSLQNFFSTAILSYCQCLARSDKFNLKIYRLVSLWLNALSQMAENRGLASCDLSEGSATESLFTPAWLASLEAHLGAIRVDKFLPLFSQLLVRLTTPNEEERRSKTQAAFHAMLAKLVKTLLSKHPYHTGLPLLSLVNAPLDDPQGGASSTTISRSKRQRIEAMADRDGGRVALARQLFSEVCRSGATREDIFAQMQALATAYIEWANVDVENKRNVKGDIPMPASCALSRLSAEAEHCLHLLPVITCPPRVNPSGVYQDLVRVVGFVNTYRLAGGLNLPKIVTCLCSDGRRRKQLVKGRDDPRQDAIMQQVFSAANHLLATFSVSNASKCPKSSSFSPSRANAMRIRTYMVVPLARRSGLIEWCEGTVPLGEWLAGEAFGAHQRYRPSDLAPSQAKLKLAGARDKSLDRKLAVFTEICSKIQPVLGFFFLEHFPEPSAWYAARWRYTASLATASILGYLVGLGDRHPHNLLLHPTTGEVVHIDLGIAFDQGRLMPTPEMVPFRLTRDLVHALGPLGVEVGFVSIAESALCAFSSGSEIILTLLEVLLHDPLYSWSLSPAQLCALEARRAEVTGCPAFPTGGGGESSIFANTSTTAATAAASGSIVNAYGTASRRPQDLVNQLAERVLLTVRDKLAGRVGGIGSSGLTAGTAAEGALGTLGPSGHVALLVRAATDPQNLGRMYFGWQAYL